MEQNVKVHSGMKIDRNPHYEPVEIFRVDEDKIRVHTLDGVECVDLGGWDETMPSCIYLYPAWMDEVDPPYEGPVETINVGIDELNIINV